MVTLRQKVFLASTRESDPDIVSMLAHSYRDLSAEETILPVASHPRDRQKLLPLNVLVLGL